MGAYKFLPTLTDIDNVNTQAIVGTLDTSFPSVVGGTNRATVITDSNYATYISTGMQDTSLGITMNPNTFMPPGATNIDILLNAVVSLSQPLGDPTDISDLRLGVWHNNPAGPTNYLRLFHWNDADPTQYSAPILALVGTGGSNNNTPWTVANIPNHVFLVRAKAGAVESPGFNIHEVWLNVTWTDPTLTATGAPFGVNTTRESAVVRIPMPSTIPECSTEVPIVLTLYYTSDTNTTTWSSVVAATFTQSFTQFITISSADPIQNFVDVELNDLTPNTQYFAYATLTQMNLSAQSATGTFATNKLVQPTMGF